jgi:hypothetical protein
MNVSAFWSDRPWPSLDRILLGECPQGISGHMLEREP